MIERSDLDEMSRVLAQYDGMRRTYEGMVRSKKREYDELSDNLVSIEKAQVFLQDVAFQTQSLLKVSVEDIVNMALDTCFPDEYDFKLEFDSSRGRMNCDMKFVSKRTGRPIDPMESVGGGVCDVTSFALRIACYVLEQGIDNVVVLDEPMKFVSKDLRGRVCEVMRKLSDKLGIQFIVVTHIDEFVDVADKVFVVSKDENGRSEVRGKEE